MTRLKSHFIAIFLITIPSLLFGKTTYSEKIVHVSAGQVSLSLLLKNINGQTACVFSYDPVKINDKQIITAPTVLNCALGTALQKLLPKNIQFRFKDKFILLQRVATVAKDVPEKKIIIPNPAKAIADPLKYKPVAVIDSSELKPVVTESSVVVQSNTVVEAPGKDTLVFIPEAEIAIVKELPSQSQRKVIVKKNNQGFGQFVKNNGVLEAELAGYSKQLAGAVHLGLYGFYAILSVGTNADKARSSGIGGGAAFKVAKQVGLCMEVLRLNLLSGQTYNLGVRTVITQFRPEFNYYLGGSIKLFAGPTFNMLNSTYVNSIKTYDLGNIFYYGGIIGIKVDLNNLFRRKS
jgi:hypothetical protein